MKILIAVMSNVWDGNSLIQYLQSIEHEVIEAKSSFILFNMLQNTEFDIAIISQELNGLADEENYISKIRDYVPIKSNRRVIFHIRHNIEKMRDELINQAFYDFLVGQFNAEELLDFIDNPRTFDDVRHFQIRTVKKVIEKEKAEEKTISEEVLSTKVLPNKVIGFHGCTATTTLWNTAIALSKDEDLKIIVADFNPNSHLSIQFLFDKYISVKCMSELIDYIRKDKLNKDTIKQFLVQHPKYKNIYLLPGFKKIEYKNFLDFAEAEEGKYVEKIIDCLKRNSNLVMIDTPRLFFYGTTLDTIKETETMYLLTTPNLLHRADIKSATNHFIKLEHNNDFRLIISSVSGTEPITVKMIYEELKDIKVYGETGKEIGSRKIFDNYLELTKVNNMNEIIEDRKYAYEIDGMEAYRKSIDLIARDIYYYQGGTYGKVARKRKSGFPNFKNLINKFIPGRKVN